MGTVTELAGDASANISLGPKLKAQQDATAAYQTMLTKGILGSSVIDLKAESARLQKEIQKLGDEVGKIDAKLGNKAFVSRAPEEVVEEQRERRQTAEQTRARLSVALERLKA